METQKTLPLAAVPATENVFLKYWNRLVEPSKELTGDDRRKATTISAFLLVFIPLAIFTVFQGTITGLLTGAATITPPNTGGMAALVLTVGAYLISRSRYYVFAAYAIIAIPYFAVVVPNINNFQNVTQISYFFLTLSILFTSLLLGWRETIVVGIITAIAIYLITILGGFVASPAIIGFAAIVTGVTALVSRIRDQFIANLQSTQEELRNQVVETEKARQEAERSDQVKSAFLASMSHELRTPLNAIINFTKFVAKGDLGEVNEDQVETLNEVVDSAKHLLNLINDVLDMSKIESGSLNLFVTDDVDLRGILNQIHSTGKSLLDNKTGVEIKTEIPEDLPRIRADRQRIVQILLNIMSNACKFTQAGTITLKAESKDKQVFISIADTGPGIPLEDQKLVYEAFKQTDTGLRQGGGTGLGMPITKSLVEAHGGKLLLDSTVGKGTTFTVSLPISSDLLIPTLT